MRVFVVAALFALVAVAYGSGDYYGGYGVNKEYAYRKRTGFSVPVGKNRDQNRDGVPDAKDRNRDGKVDGYGHYGYGHAGYGHGGYGHDGYGYGNSGYGYGRGGYGNAGYGYNDGYGYGSYY